MRASLLFVLVLVPTAFTQDTSRAILERAIVAHGGHEQLARVHADKVRLKGTLQVGDSAVAFTNDLTLQLPAQFKSVLTLHTFPKSRTITYLLDGDRATVLLDGQPQPITAAQLGQLKQTLQLEQALRLVPLLSDAAFALQPLPEVRYNAQVYVGVRVQGKGQRDVKLYFDQSSGLLVKAEHRLPGPDGKDVVQEAYYGDYRDVGGFRRAGKVVVMRDGKKAMEAELVEAQRYERIDPVEFTRP